MVDVTSVDPDVAAPAKPESMAPAGDLDPPQAKKLHRPALPDVEDVLLRIGAREDDGGVLVGGDPDGGFRRAADPQVPHRANAVGSSGDNELIARPARAACAILVR